MNVRNAGLLLALVASLGCSNETSSSSPSSEEPGSVDACALLSRETVATELEVDETLEVGADNGTFVGEYLGTCGYTWAGGSSRLALTIEADPGNRYLDRYRESGLPFTEPVEDLGAAAFVRSDGAVSWGYDDQRIYVLYGETAPATPMAAETLAALARTITRP
ncbi:MAG: hypothetical protein H6724_17695 [Sandaracinus sp.]|nr:hypothetical protein [Sandaracinus sp.]MCB9623193.1 hypothetical protein [Sandaracinus sp.]